MLSVKGSKLDFAGENVITFILHIKKRNRTWNTVTLKCRVGAHDPFPGEGAFEHVL